MNKKIFIIIGITVILAVAVCFWYVHQNINHPLTAPDIGVSVKVPATSTPVIISTKNQTPTVSTTVVIVPSDTKTYTNTEWGFEFQYPKDWEIVENPYGSSNLKFTLLAVPVDRTLVHAPDPFLVSIVSPDFAKQQFSDVQNSSSEITIDGIHGVKYTYEEESLQLIAIILPLGRNMIGLGTDKEYEQYFNQILSTFKFLK